MGNTEGGKRFDGDADKVVKRWLSTEWNVPHVLKALVIYTFVLSFSWGILAKVKPSLPMKILAIDNFTIKLLTKDDWSLNGTSLTFLQALVIYFVLTFSWGILAKVKPRLFSHSNHINILSRRIINVIWMTKRTRL